MQRHIGRVGLQQQRVERQLRQRVAGFAGAFISQGAADADRVAEFDKRLRLLQAAGKAVHHAAPRQIVAAQVQRQLVVGAARMQDHRQIILLRQPQLRVEQKLLARKLRILHIEVEADLPYCRQLRRLLPQPVFQLLEMGVFVALNGDGMQAERGVESGMLRRQRNDARKAAGLHCRHDNALYARFGGARDAGRLIADEGREIEMAVGIGKSHASEPSS